MAHETFGEQLAGSLGNIKALEKQLQVGFVLQSMNQPGMTENINRELMFPKKKN